MAYTIPNLWHQPGTKQYETGVSRGMLYVVDRESGVYGDGVAWQGISSIDENPTGGEATAIWADNIKYLNLRSVEEFEGTINAYMYPKEFGYCDGSAEIFPGVYVGQQARSPFGLSYTTIIGNDLDDRADEKVHIVYGASVSPSDKTRETINDTPDANEFSWDFETIPIDFPGARPTSHIEIIKSDVLASTGGEDKWDEFLKFLYEGEGPSAAPKLPMPADIARILGNNG